MLLDIIESFEINYVIIFLRLCFHWFEWCL